MREIKFEYGFYNGDSIIKKWYYIGQIPTIAQRCDVWNNLPVLYVRQFTGLKDKNGKEIYEGDIVTSFGGSKGVVEFFDKLTWDGGCIHSGFYCKQWFEYKEEGEMSYHSNFEDGEVIGNIHENPELVEDTP